MRQRTGGLAKNLDPIAPPHNSVVTVAAAVVSVKDMESPRQPRPSPKLLVGKWTTWKKFNSHKKPSTKMCRYEHNFLTAISLLLIQYNTNTNAHKIRTHYWFHFVFPLQTRSPSTHPRVSTLPQDSTLAVSVCSNLLLWMFSLCRHIV